MDIISFALFALSDTVSISLVSGVVGPAIVGIMVSVGAWINKRQDWAREDLVASRAAQVSATLLETNARIAASTAEQSRHLKEIDGKQDIIHDLVNSRFTAAMERELTALKSQLAMMREVENTTGLSARAIEARQALEEQVTGLQAEVDERKRNDEVAVNAARTMSDEHTAADKQQQAAQMQNDAADKQILAGSSREQ